MKPYARCQRVRIVAGCLCTSAACLCYSQRLRHFGLCMNHDGPFLSCQHKSLYFALTDVLHCGRTPGSRWQRWFHFTRAFF